LNSERIGYWIGKGARPSAIVRRLIEKHPAPAPAA
jgi:ribosomal protein S16